MNRKDYIKFAAMFEREITRAKTKGIGSATMIVMACNTADIFEADNPNFNRDRFLKACGVES